MVFWLVFVIVLFWFAVNVRVVIVVWCFECVFVISVFAWVFVSYWCWGGFVRNVLI